MNIAVYCGSSPQADSRYLEAATALGTWIGSSGNTLVYGGSSIGLMGAVSRAVLAAGGSAIGVEPEFFIRAGVEQHELTELIVVDTMSERKAKMIELADVFVALPGGVGTLEEIAEILSRLRLHLEHGPCYFLNMDGFYEGLAQLFARMEQGGFIEQESLAEYVFVDTVASLIERLSGHVVVPRDRDEVPTVPESNLQIG